MRKFKVLNTPLKKAFLFLMGGFFVFLLGFGVGNYKWFPYSLIERSKNFLLPEIEGKESLSPEVSFLNEAFTDELIQSEKIFKPIHSFEGINLQNESIFVDLDKFADVFENINIRGFDTLSLDHGATKVARVEFEFFDKLYSAYSYYIPSKPKSGRHAALIIPGSGFNQASKIYNREKENYHRGVLEIVNGLDNFESYVFIKPNEGILAYHNGEGKLNYNFIINYHLNQGGSYSASYLLQSMAFEKFLQEKYDKNIVMGLSQGGLATLINSLESKPDVAVISSGYSILNYEKFEWSGHDQIIIPGISQELKEENLSNKLRENTTSWIFTFGKEENGTYRLEAEEHYTKKAIGDFPNVEVVIHEHGHVFPIKELLSSLKEKLN